MLPELLEQDHHRQQAGTGPAASQHMERRRCLANLLAVATSELLADVLDHLPLPRNGFQCLGNVLAQFAQPRAAVVTGVILPRSPFENSPRVMPSARPSMIPSEVGRGWLKCTPFRPDTGDSRRA
jgi:hypothetical protein